MGGEPRKKKKKKRRSSWAGAERERGFCFGCIFEKPVGWGIQVWIKNLGVMRIQVTEVMGADEVARTSYRVRKDQGQKLPLLLPIFKTKIAIGAFLSMAWSLWGMGSKEVQLAVSAKTLGRIHRTKFYLGFVPSRRRHWGGNVGRQAGRPKGRLTWCEHSP